MKPGTVYLAQPHLHLTVDGAHRFALVDHRRIRHLRSSANPLFSSAAEVFGPRLLAVVLTGLARDGTDGVQRGDLRGIFDASLGDRNWLRRPGTAARRDRPYAGAAGDR
jgi:chemotaxis response regulator CheB